MKLTDELIKELHIARDKAEFISSLNLSNEEVEALRLMIKELEEQGDSQYYRELQREDFREVPVSGAQFLSDPYLFGRPAESFFPGIIQDFISIIDNGVPILELILHGALRWGKSFLACAIIAYHIYKLSLMKNPQRYLGLAESSDIYFINLSVTGYQAKEGVFSELRGMLDLCPYFTRDFPFDPKMKSILRFQNGVIAKSGSSSEFTAIGKNVYGSVLDEANFFGVKKRSTRSTDPTGEYDGAKVLYNALMRRTRLTFTQFGVAQGVGILSSSARHPKDFVERRIAQIKKSQDPYTKVVHHPMWETRPKDFYILDKFSVEVGDEFTRSRILTGEEKPEDIKGRVVKEVPGEFKNQFIEDIDGAIRDVCGIATLSVSPFFDNREHIKTAFAAQDHEFYQHPWTEDVSINLNGAILLDTLIERDPQSGAFRPKINPDISRTIHFDLSEVKDPVGIAMGHVCGYKKVQIMNPDSHEITTQTMPVVMMDLVLRVFPPPNGSIDYEKMVQLVYKLKMYGFNIETITSDQFAHQVILQPLTKKGYNAVQKSSRMKDYEPYAIWKSAVNQGRWKCYYYQPLIQEMACLERDLATGVIDHPPDDFNDVSDAVAAVTHTLIEKYLGYDSRTVAIPASSVNMSLSDVEKQVYDTLITTVNKPEEILYNIEEDIPGITAAVDKLIGQGIPIEWEDYLPEQREKIDFYLSRRAADLIDLGRTPQAYAVIEERARLKRVREYEIESSKSQEIILRS